MAQTRLWNPVMRTACSHLKADVCEFLACLALWQLNYLLNTNGAQIGERQYAINTTTNTACAMIANAITIFVERSSFMVFSFYPKRARCLVECVEPEFLAVFVLAHERDAFGLRPHSQPRRITPANDSRLQDPDEVLEFENLRIHVIVEAEPVPEVHFIRVIREQLRIDFRDFFHLVSCVCHCAVPLSPRARPLP